MKVPGIEELKPVALLSIALRLRYGQTLDNVDWDEEARLLTEVLRIGHVTLQLKEPRHD